MKRLLLFFGSDLRGRDGPQFLKRQHGRGYTVLALDSAAMALAANAGIPYAVMEDWLGPHDITNALATAEECGRSWFQAARDEFTVDGICWPRIDQGTMNWFWQDATLSLALVGQLKRSDYQEFQFFRGMFSRASVWNAGSDVCSALWQAELPGRTEAVLRRDWKQWEFWSDAVRGGARRLRSSADGTGLKDVSPELPFPRDSIVIVMGHEEALRFDHIVQQLSSHFPGRVAVVIGGPYAESSGAITHGWGVPVSLSATWPVASWLSAFPSRLLPTVDSDVAARLLDACHKALDAADGRPWEKPLRHLRFHFQYYCKYRWPKLCKSNLTYWRRLWEDNRPAAILVTARGDTVFFLAIEAARALGIHTVLLPHGGITRLHKQVISADSLLYGNLLQRSVLAASGLPEERFVGCRGLLASNEYPVEPINPFSTQDKWRILALTEPTGEGPHLHRYVLLTAQLEALRALVQPPPDLEPKIDLAVKVHPSNSDLEIVEAAGTQVLGRVLPVKSDLDHALSEADLVIAVNFRGTALIHCMLNAKPVIALSTEPPSMDRQSEVLTDLFVSGTTPVGTSSELWQAVRDFFQKPEKAEAMRRAAREFAEKYLNDSQFPTLPEHLEKTLVTRRVR